MKRTSKIPPSNLKKNWESLGDKLHSAKNIRKNDSFFEDSNFFNANVPNDLSANHDEYLKEK